MRRLFAFCFCILFLPAFTRAQTLPGLKDLAVPSSPGFQLVDLSPTLVESPATPKELALGLLQSMDGTSAWPQNYSLETAPYWWSGTSRSAYHVMGVTAMGKSAPFSGLRFTSLTAAFMQKDMVPDAVEESQKIFAAGFRTTLLQLRSKAQTDNIHSYVQAWLRQAEETSIILMDPAADPQAIADALAARDSVKGSIVQKLSRQLAEKPLFTLDLAGAYGVYGIANDAWRTGRYGAWATAALNLPLRSAEEKRSGVPAGSHLSVLVLGRYLRDEFVESDAGPVASGVMDVGGKLMLQIQRFTVGVEGMVRGATESAATDPGHRLVGTAAYRVRDNVYVNAAFGRNFENPDKLVSLFGIALGFGEERLSLPSDADGNSEDED